MFDGLDAECGGDVALACAGPSDQHDVVGAVDETDGAGLSPHAHAEGRARSQTSTPRPTWQDCTSPRRSPTVRGSPTASEIRCASPANRRIGQVRGCSSEVERQLPKLNVVGSIPIARSSLFTRENKGLAEIECPEVSLDFSSCARSGPKSLGLSKAKPLSGMLETPLTKTVVLVKDQKNAAAGPRIA